MGSNFFILKLTFVQFALKERPGERTTRKNVIFEHDEAVSLHEESYVASYGLRKTG